MSQFAFAAEFTEFHAHAVRAEATALADPLEDPPGTRLGARGLTGVP